MTPPPPTPSPNRMEFDLGNMDPYDTPTEACLHGITDENVWLAAGVTTPVLGATLYEDQFGGEPYFGNGHSYYYLTNGVDSWACKVVSDGEITEITAC